MTSLKKSQLLLTIFVMSHMLKELVFQSLLEQILGRIAVIYYLKLINFILLKIIFFQGMTTLLTLAAMFSAIATTTPRVSYSSKLDIWMVFCVIFVFGTLMEFSLLIFLQKQVFGPKVILPSWKNLLCRPKATSTNTLGGSVYRKRRHSIPTEDMGGPTSNNTNGGSQVL